MPTLSQVLSEQFELMRARGETLETAGDEARLLGISPGHLSRIRHSRAPLTDELAARIAAIFEPRDEVRRGALLRQLHLVRSSLGRPEEAPALDIVHHAVSSLFGLLARSGTILCVEYREVPQAVSSGPYAELADAAAFAVAEGLSFALFQPFGTVEQLLKLQNSTEPPYEPMSVRQYRLRVAQLVRRVYREMKQKAHALAGSNFRGQIALYEARNAPSVGGSGIQSRLFYAQYPDSNRNDAPRNQIFEWIVGAAEHSFIERNREFATLEAVRDQFHPITTAWIADKRLPETEAELVQVYERHGYDSELLSDLPHGSEYWSVFVEARG